MKGFNHQLAQKGTASLSEEQLLSKNFWCWVYTENNSTVDYERSLIHIWRLTDTPRQPQGIANQ